MKNRDKGTFLFQSQKTEGSLDPPSCSGLSQFCRPCLPSPSLSLAFPLSSLSSPFLPAWTPAQTSALFFGNKPSYLQLHQLPAELFKMIKAHSLLLVFGKDLSSILSVENRVAKGQASSAAW